MQLCISIPPFRCQSLSGSLYWSHQLVNVTEVLSAVWKVRWVTYYCCKIQENEPSINRIWSLEVNFDKEREKRITVTNLCNIPTVQYFHWNNQLNTICNHQLLNYCKLGKKSKDISTFVYIGHPCYVCPRHHEHEP